MKKSKIASGLGCSKRGLAFGLWSLVMGLWSLCFVVSQGILKPKAKPKVPRPKTMVRMQLQQFAPLNYNPQFLER
jgi:hypothetical protein